MSKTAYSKIIEEVFRRKHTSGATQIAFEREDIVKAAKRLRIPEPKNLGDVLYSFRYRNDLPKDVAETAPEGLSWLIRPAGTSKYRFELSALANITPRDSLAATKVPDSTPGVIAMYALTDEQALLAKLRYNRLIDIFTGVACYSLQNHLRTSVPGVGQVETDELYIGVDRHGAHYAFPVQAKGGSDRLSIIQIEQDFAMCRKKFPQLLCRPIAAQFIDERLIALFDFEEQDGLARISSERHYQLVPREEMTDTDLATYRLRSQMGG